jgi:hypothetical protein
VQPLENAEIKEIGAPPSCLSAGARDAAIPIRVLFRWCGRKVDLLPWAGEFFGWQSYNSKIS